MTSKSLTRNAFLDPEEQYAPRGIRSKEVKYKQANVYEAVAGKISSQGFIPSTPHYASTRDTASSSSKAVPPENVLYRRHNAPLRYAESDVYFANEKRSHLDLPDSDLLKATHVYASDFYSRGVHEGRSDFKSLDETALLALGILLEEAMRGSLGRTGDIVFTEGEEVPVKLSGSRREESGSGRSKAKRRGTQE